MRYVYVIKRNNGDFLYIGFTRDFKHRLNTHISEGTAVRGETFAIIFSFASEIDARIYELYLINRYKPRWNRDRPEGICNFDVDVRVNDKDIEATKWINDKLVIPIEVKDLLDIPTDNGARDLLGVYV